MVSQKKIFLMSTLLIFAINVFAQGDVVRQEENKSSSPESFKLELIKNKNAKEVVAEGGIRIDKRVVKYYPEGALDNTSKEKAIKLNHIYIDSYDLLNISAQNNGCELMLKNEFDLGEYNYLRNENERVTVEANFNGCFFQLSLYSWAEIEKLN